MKNLKDTLFWKKKYGVLPLHLKDINEDRYLMLNGGNGDFCLQTFDEGNEMLFKEYAWSANTKNYLIVKDDDVEVVNWLDDKKESFKKGTILNSIDAFHKYLINKSYTTSNDVIPFVLHVFRKLRNETNEKQSPNEALSLLFQLLINLEDSIPSGRFYDFDKVKTPLSFDLYLGMLKDGVRSIKPNLHIILRHVSGALFEEAHKEVVFFDHQLDLFGGKSSKQKNIVNQYSSVHYTPAFIARSIVENSLKQLDLEKPTLKIMDPSCGASEFIMEALKQLKDAGYQGRISIIGYDISDIAIQTSNFLLHYENETQWQGNLDITIQKVNNSLEFEWDKDIDLLLMNPPFISWELIKDKYDRDVLIDVLGSNLSRSKPNLASGFFYKAVQTLNNGGVIGCILPTSIFSFDSYQKLRNEIREMIDLQLVAKLGNYAFENALTDVSIFVGKKPQSNNVPQIIWTNNEKGILPDVFRELRRIQSNNEIASINKDFNIYTPRKFPIMSENWKIVTQKEEEFIDELEIYVAKKRLVRLIDVFTVRQGIRSGNKAFTINTPGYDELPSNEKKLYRKIIDNKSIKKGQIISHKYIFYPYDENGLNIKNESYLLEIAPQTYSYLYQYKDTLSKRARKSSDNWWTLSEHRAWLRIKNKHLFSTEFGRSDSFALDETGEYVVERGNAWIPKSKFKDEDYYFYLALLSSSMFDRLLNIYSKQLAGGSWYDLGAKYTKNIPIPNVAVARQNNSAFLKLSGLGKDLSLGNGDAIYSINEVVKQYYPLV